MKSNSEKHEPLITQTDQKMLELLVKGASSKVIAKSLGYKDGTTRVYLHSLYQRIGVNNKTSAVSWYLSTQNRVAVTTPSVLSQAKKLGGIQSFGQRALETDLLSSLGVMEIFIGPHSKMWEIANRLGNTLGTTLASDSEQVRINSRQLWCALLRGDFAEGKRQYDAGVLPRLFLESPTDAVVLASLLLLGGFSASAQNALVAMPVKKAGSIGITQEERTALVALSDAINVQNNQALFALHHLATNGVSHPVFRHWLIVLLFHIYRIRCDVERAAIAANAVWAEAEAVRHHLQAIGDKTLVVDNQLPEPAAQPHTELKRYIEKILA